MLKNVLIIVLLLVVFNAVFVFSGGLDLLMKTEQADEAKKSSRVDQNIVEVFRFTLEDEVTKKQGQPIEGFEPQMFIAAFPGLTETDFDGVKSSIGQYVVVDGRLEHDLGNPKGPIHSAAGAINRAGYETLLNNITKRTGINLHENGTITDVMNVLTAQ